MVAKRLCLLIAFILNKEGGRSFLTSKEIKEDPIPESGDDPKGPVDWMTILFPILLVILVLILLFYTNLIRGGFFR
jgi:hypothetical protein